MSRLRISRNPNRLRALAARIALPRKTPDEVPRSRSYAGRAVGPLKTLIRRVAHREPGALGTLPMRQSARQSFLSCCGFWRYWAAQATPRCGATGFAYSLEITRNRML